MADSLYANNDFAYAATCYEKCFYTTEDANEKNRALIGRANSFKNLKDLRNQERTLNRINFSILSDSALSRIQYEKALNLYLQYRYEESDELLRRVYSLNINDFAYQKSILLHGFVLNELFLFDEAKNKLIEFSNSYFLVPAIKDSIIAEINHWYSNKNIPKIKSLKKARNLQRWIPGAGLFYAGYPGRAIGNVFLQLAGVGFIGYNVWQENYVTASTGGLYLLSMFYAGGLNQTNELVPKKNYTIAKTFNEEVKRKFTELMTNKL